MIEEHILLMKTLADPTRMKILKLLLAAELCVCELKAVLGISQPAVSQHLAKLKAAGLVKERKEGPWTIYQGDLQRVTAAFSGILAFMAADPATIPELAQLTARLQTINRVEVCSTDRSEGGK